MYTAMNTKQPQNKVCIKINFYFYFLYFVQATLENGEYKKRKKKKSIWLEMDNSQKEAIDVSYENFVKKNKVEV